MIWDECKKLRDTAWEGQGGLGGRGDVYVKTGGRTASTGGAGWAKDNMPKQGRH